MRSDHELLEAWQSGDNHAGNDLFERHFDSLYRFFAAKCGGEAKDLIQKTLLACVKASEKFRGESSFRTFLFGIARNVLLHHWRERTRTPPLDFGVSSIADLVASPRALAAEYEEQQLLHAALLRIPVDLQIALELFYWENMSSAEIAEVLGIPAGTVRSRLRRAREAVKDALTELAPTPALLESTAQNLEAWTRSLDACVSRRDDDPNAG